MGQLAPIFRPISGLSRASPLLVSWTPLLQVTAMTPISFRPQVLTPGAAVATVPAQAQTGFASALKDALDGVNSAQKSADGLAREFQLDNPNVSLEETMIALQKANISFQAVVQVRNKLVAAYQDIMNMPV
jgi:flagellar hook-basal body complex protein FliE